MAVELPIDHLTELWPESLRGGRIGALLHPASLSSGLEHTSRVLERLNGSLLRLGAFFGPQHGYLGQTQENMIEWESYCHPRLGIPVYSLYGETREPTPEMLHNLDALLIDLQDVGTRYYTFIWTMDPAIRACRRAGIAVIGPDRPNPINGLTTEGPLLDPAYYSFVGLHPLPVRHGRTIGELARQFCDEAFPQTTLHVLPMDRWDRGMWFDQTGLPWVIPSPNMPTLDTAIVYPGMCLLEGTNISEGRGTTRPFETFGAPFIDAEECCAQLNQLKLPGVYFRETYFQPTFHKFAGQLCGGGQLHVVDRNQFQSFATGVEIIRHLRKRYSIHFMWKQPPVPRPIPPSPHRGFDWWTRDFVLQGLIVLFTATATPVCADIPWNEAKTRLKQENNRLAHRPGGRNGTYFVICTLYYTPVESGFTAERGFDTRMETRRGLKGHTYPHDFLQAVKKEGFGRITQPVNDRNYIRYHGGGSFRFASYPAGHSTDRLIPRHSAATRRGQPGLTHGVELVTTDRVVQKVFGSSHWTIVDSGGGIRRWQVDLYWGEDAPLGPGRLMARPHGTDFEYAYSEARIQR